MSKIMRLKPTNRHLLIVPHISKNETNSGVLLPDDYEPEMARYTEATVIDVADDCDVQFRKFRYDLLNENKKIIVDASMIQEIKLKDRTHHMILENYVVAVYRGPDEG